MIISKMKQNRPKGKGKMPNEKLIIKMITRKKNLKKKEDMILLETLNLQRILQQVHQKRKSKRKVNLKRK